MTPIRIAITRAGTWRQRLRGLIGQPPPPAGAGLLLEPCRAIHTIGLRGPIDVVFVDRRGFVVRVLRGFGVCRFAWCAQAHATLELRLGEASRLGLWEGCRLDLVEPETRHNNAGPCGTRQPRDVSRKPKRGAST